MRREHALQFVGAMVEAHTSMNGEYVGQLVEVTTDRPWRGRVLLTGVLAPAAIEDSYGTRQRRGHKLGTILEVGGANIVAPARRPGTSYIEALRRDLQAKELTLATGGYHRKDERMLREIAEHRRRQLAEYGR